MSKQWIQVYSAANNLEAHSLKGMLESACIAVRLTGESLGSAVGELPTNAVEVGLWVEAEYTAQAGRLLQDYEQAEYRDWICTQCNETNEGQFEICWQCGCEKP
jgi:hypothetical protein